MNRSLSKDLEHYRPERPDEWIMDRFIRKSLLLEAALVVLTESNSNWKMGVSDHNEQAIEKLVKEIYQVPTLG